MKTEAVMCMALTSTRPSWTPLFLTAASTWAVMLMKSIRAGTLNVRCSVCAFMFEFPGSGRRSGEEVGAEVFEAAVAREERNRRAGLARLQELPGRGQMRPGRESGQDPL